jgi:hypothetical protein
VHSKILSEESSHIQTEGNCSHSRCAAMATLHYNF